MSINKTAQELNSVATAKFGELTASVELLNALYADEKADRKSVEKALENANDLLKEYNVLRKQLVYATLYEQKNPMLAACSYGRLTKEKLSINKESNQYELGEAQERYMLDLVEFDRQYPGKGQLSRNGQWPAWVTTYAKVLAKDVCAGMELDRGTREQIMKEYAEEKELKGWACLSGANEKSRSMSNLTKDLQGIIDGILFIPSEKNPGVNKYKVVSRDVKFIRECFTQGGRKGILDIEVKSDRGVRDLIARVVYHLVTGNDYSVIVK